MSSVPPTESTEAQPTTTILSWGGQKRFKYFTTGVVGPIGCLAATFLGMNPRLNSLWQSGELEVYLKLMLEPRALSPFFPLLTYSMVGLGACCLKPSLAERPWVRFGVYSGGILSLQYVLIVVFTASFLPLVCSAIVGTALALVTFVFCKLMPRAKKITIFQLMLLTAVVAVLASAFAAWSAQEKSARWDNLAEYIFGSIFVILAAIPFLNSMTYVRATFALLRSPALSLISQHRQLLTLSVSWLFGFAASWKLSLDAMLAEYAKLPTTPPKCYVSAAAAHGHPGFVGVHQFARTQKDASSPNPFPLNLQMCRLKFLEFTLAATSPTLHRNVRRFYDMVGPHAAVACRRNVWLADASYVALKPIEYLACCIQRLAGISTQRVREIYTAR